MCYLTAYTMDCIIMAITNMRKIFSRHEVQFIMWFCGIFLISIALLALFGLIPSEFSVTGGETLEQKTRSAVREFIEGKPSDTASNAAQNGAPYGQPIDGSAQLNGSNSNNNYPLTVNTTAGTSETIYAEDPIRLVIPTIALDTVVVNPKNTNHEVLDAELQKGAVHYPGSGYPGSGNMFLFGHSTGFSVVQNQAYKVFNKLKNLKQGDEITVYGKVGVYTYRVTSVKKAPKESVLVTFDTKKNMITLSTCDSFGKRTDRYVVEGDLISISKRS